MNFKRVFIVFAALFGCRIFAASEDVLISSQTVEVSTETVVMEAVEPFVWPVSRKIQGSNVGIVSKFGQRKALGTGPLEKHEGVDFGVPPGSSVKAARSGKVLFAGFSREYTQRADKKQQNRLVIVRHADGTSTRYVHLATLKVRPPQEVKAGDILGTTDSSDEVPMPVLHFEIRTAGGNAIDPAKVFANEGLIP